jgi:hypothetical protein
MEQSIVPLYFGKLSTEYPQQLERNFYAGGEPGSTWYNEIKEGDLVFAIYKGAVHKLWRVKAYTSENFGMDAKGAVLFDVVRAYDPPVALNEFILCRHFTLDLNLLNRSAKQTTRGFYPIQLREPFIDPAQIDFNSEKRRIVIGMREASYKLDDNDIIVRINNDEKLSIDEIATLEEGRLYNYSPLVELYQKKAGEEIFRLRELLDHAIVNGNQRKERYLRRVIAELDEFGYYEVENPVDFYDTIIVGPSPVNNRKRYWAGGVMWGDTNKAEEFISVGYWEIGYDPGDPKGQRYYDKLRQVKEGDRFLLKKWGGHPQLTIYAIGTVTAVDKAEEGMVLINWDKDFTERGDAAPTGPGADIWRLTLIEVRRADIIKNLFGEEKDEAGDAESTSAASHGSSKPPPPPPPTEEIGAAGDEGDRTPPPRTYEIFPNYNIRSTGVDPVMGVADIAEEMAEVLKGTGDEPGAMIGVFGRWGRGKTYFVNRLWEKLDEKAEDNSFIRIDFHAWKYQDTPASWAYLYETFAEAFLSGAKHYPPEEKDGGINKDEKFARQLVLNWTRINRTELFVLLLTVLTGVVMIILTAFNIIGSTGIIIPAAGVGIISSVIVFLNKYKAQAIDLFRQYASKHSYSSQLGMQAEIQKELITLLKVWIKEQPVTDANGKAIKRVKKKILLFVDDIDRCKEDRIIEVVDSLRVMLEDAEISKRVIVIAAVDERILQRAVRWKYTHLLREKELDGELDALTREYVDKLFLVGVKLGELTSEEKREYYITLTKDKVGQKFVAKNTNAVADPGDYDEEDDEEAEEEVPKVSENKTGKELTFEDSEQLLNSIANFDDITPRQIRILYYRYLIAKKLIFRKVRTNRKKFNLFFELDKTFIPELLRSVSNEGDHGRFHHIRETLRQKNQGEVTVVLKSGKEYTIDRELLVIIINTLEIVVAY